MEYYAGAASAAALGYIAGNWKGAFKAKKAFDNFYKNKSTPMPKSQKGTVVWRDSPYPQQRARLFGTSSGSSGSSYKGPSTADILSRIRKMRTPSSSGSSRSSSRSMSISSAASSKKAKKVATAMMRNNQSMVSVNHKVLKKGFKSKVKRNVKVSKLLRKKITQVMDGKKVTGTARIQSFGCYIDNRPSNIVSQAVYPLPLAKQGTTDPGCLFSWEQIMYMASRLWNGRPSPVSGSWSEFYTESSANPLWSNFSTGFSVSNPNPTAFSVEVSNLKARIVLRNNSKMAHILTLYVCKPKYQRRDIETSASGKVINDWVKAVEVDQNATVKGGSVNASVATAINVGGGVTTQGATPKTAKNFGKLWSYDSYKIVLEPGQQHTHWIQGDEKVYDFSKMYKKNNSGSGFEFCNMQPTDRYVFFTGYPRMSTFIEDGLAYSGNCQGTDGYGINVFTEIYAALKMPEFAGTSVTSVANAQDVARMQPLTQRKRAYFTDVFYEYSNTGPRSAMVNIDDNNPASSGA